MSQAKTILQTHEPEEIVAMYPEEVQAAIDDAEDNGRHAFAAAIRAAREQVRDGDAGA